MWLLRRRARRLEHQRTRAPRRHPWSTRIRELRPRAAAANRERQSSHRAHRAQLDVSIASAPVALAHTPGALRSARYHTFHAAPALGPQFVGRPVVPTTGQYHMGTLPDFHSPVGPTSTCPASGRRRAPTAQSRRVRPAASRSPAPGAAASLASAPSAAKPRFPRRNRMDGSYMVPGRRTLRTSGTHSRSGNPSVAIRSRVLRAASASASAAWTASGVTFAQAVLGRGQGVAAAATLIGQSLAPSTQGAYQRLWVAFAAFCRVTGRNALPASPATVCAYLGTLFEGARFAGSLSGHMLLRSAPSTVAWCFPILPVTSLLSWHVVGSSPLTLDADPAPHCGPPPTRLRRLCSA
jgi:hypothetical protein